MDTLGFIRECAKNELDGVELLGVFLDSTDKDYLRTIRKTCADLFVNVAMVSAGGHLTTSDDAKRANEVKDIAKWVEAASFLGAPCVRFFSGSGKELADGGAALETKVVAAMREVCDIGQKYGVTMALENHGGTTSEQLLGLFHKVNHPYLRFTLDVGNFPPNSHVGPNTYSDIEKCAPHAAIIHAKFFNVNADGSDKEFDWHKIHGILKKARFGGYLSVEFEGEAPDEVGEMRRIAKFLKTLR